MLFFKFNHFKLTSKQKQHFIESLIFPVLAYNIEMWFRSATEGERTKLLKLFSRNNFYLDIPLFISERMDKLAASFVSDQNHILNSCYSRSRKYFLLYLECVLNAFYTVLYHRVFKF